MKNQTKKKGQDTDDPYGFHMYNYNNKCLDADTSKSLKFTYKELDDPFIDINALKNVWFPKELKLDKEGKRYVEVLQ
jgi:hypothetical protein